MKICRPTAKSVVNFHNRIGLKFFTRLRLRLSHLDENKFKDNFRDCANLLCLYNLNNESLSHFFLHCHCFRSIPSTLFGNFRSVDVNIPNFPDNEIVEILLYSSPKFDFNQNNKILSSSVTFILKSERFNDSLL